VAEDVRAAISARPMTIAGEELTLTVSVGWTTWEDDDLGQLLARADRALYEAKSAGRDCVRPHADSTT
jgi:diguanylate cyclase (GGDEF)-like protein